MKINFNPIIEIQDDGLIKNPARIWTEKKYKLLGGYCDIFPLCNEKRMGGISIY